MSNIERSDPINRAGFGAVEVGGVGFSTSSCNIGARSNLERKVCLYTRRTIVEKAWHRCGLKVRSMLAELRHETKEVYIERVK